MTSVSLLRLPLDQAVLELPPALIGFIEVEQLRNHFEDEGLHKKACAHDARRHYSLITRRICQLYGYMAEKGDSDSFSQHANGHYLLGLAFV